MTGVFLIMYCLVRLFRAPAYISDETTRLIFKIKMTFDSFAQFVEQKLTLLTSRSPMTLSQLTSDM